MPRWLLPTLIVAATALFVTGVVIERNSEDAHVKSSSSTAAESDTSGSQGEEAHSEGEGEGAGAETDEHISEPATHDADAGAEDKLLGIDVESTPLVALAAVASLALALAVWLRPGVAPLLTLLAVALIAFAALDIREIFHQVDEDKVGLALVAALVGVLHLSASAIAIVTRRQAVA